MAVIGTITRSRKNDFVEIADSEDQLPQFVENASSGDSITIHTGSYDKSINNGKSIKIPSGVNVVILPGASVNFETNSGDVKYPLFSGNTENIFDLNQISSQNFENLVSLFQTNPYQQEVKEIELSSGETREIDISDVFSNNVTINDISLDIWTKDVSKSEWLFDKSNIKIEKEFDTSTSIDYIITNNRSNSINLKLVYRKYR